ncbi:MAG: hypothetical protein OQJ87_04140 [Rhodospirillales bacterium]|nr:hypothetical protein [Rhodospirillales bacterium]MCW9001888.1 hypothetical protein [Rhodospirillales bacterium]
MNPFMAPVVVAGGKGRGQGYRPVLVYLTVGGGGAAKSVCQFSPRIRDALTAYFYSNPVQLGAEPGLVEASYEDAVLNPVRSVIGEGIVAVSLIDASSGSPGLFDKLLHLKSESMGLPLKVTSCRLSN